MKRTLRAATWRDYRGQLAVPELKRFDGRQVESITLEEMAVAVEEIHRRGVERQAEHVASVVRPFWKFLGSPSKRTSSGVPPRVMRELVAPQRSQRPDGTDKQKEKYTPSMIEVGRIVAICKSGVMHPVVSAGIELIAFTCQSVAQTVPAMREKFDPKDGLWAIPAPHRKTARKRGDLSDHVLPMSAAAWAAVERAVNWSEENGDRLRMSRRVFPQLRPRNADDRLDDLALFACLVLPILRKEPHLRGSR